MSVTGKNFSGQVTPSIIDTEYIRCNFLQRVPVDDSGSKRGVRLFPGDDTPRTFTQCNLINCEPPPGSVVIDCNTTIKGYSENTTSEIITINGEDVVLQHHAHIVYGRWTPGGYVDFATPEEQEVD